MLITRGMLPLAGQAGLQGSPGKFRAVETVRATEQSPSRGGGRQSFLPAWTPEVGGSCVVGDIRTACHI